MDAHPRESTVSPPPPGSVPPPPDGPGPWVLIGPDGHGVPLPPALVEVLRLACEAFADGAPVTLSRPAQTLTTQEAADLLGVSRPTLVRLLDHGAIPYEQPGTHRRLRLADVLDHQRRCQHEEPAPPPA